MPHEGYADPVRNDGPRLHSNIPVSKLTERVTRAIEASDVSSAPLVVRNHEWGNAQNSTDPYQAQRGLGAQDTQTPQLRLGPRLRLARSHRAPDAWIHNSDSPDPPARPMPGSVSPSHPIPQPDQRLDLRL